MQGNYFSGPDILSKIADLSKIVMYEFHYDYMKLKYGVNLQLCYMDTDSLVYYIKTDNFYKGMAMSRLGST